MTNTTTSKSLKDLKSVYNNKETIIKFLKKIEWDCCVTEISDLYSNLWWIEEYDELIDLWCDLYFVSYLPSKELIDTLDNMKYPPRCKYGYVDWTSYARVDFDIRDAVYKKENRVIDDDELLDYIQKIKDLLDKDEALCDYNAIVNSGNWAHFYWIGEEIEITPDEYSCAAECLLEDIKHIMIKNNLPELCPDFACKNISRLMRLPGSVNTKCKYWLPEKEVELLYFNETDSDIIAQFPEVWKDALKKAKEKEEHIINSVKNIGKKFTYSLCPYHGSLFNRINDEIDIRDLVTAYTWWTVAKNWKNFISNRDWQYTWAYAIPEENIVIWSWTPHLKNQYIAYSPFSFILVHYANNNSSETFRIAKRMCPRLKEDEDKSNSKTFQYGLN